MEAGSKDAKAAKAGYEPGGGEGKDRRIPRGYGKIVRDEKGNVVDVILDEDAASTDGPSPATAMDAENELDGRQPESLPGADWLLKGEAGMELDVVRGGCHTIITAMGTNVLHDVLGLEDRSREGAPRAARTSSGAEVKYLQQLVATYGEDYERMARDRKRNVHQYTAGQLRRAIAKAIVTMQG